MFNDIFNISGSIYKLDSKNFKSGMTGWSVELISECDEVVFGEEYISNALEELVRLDKDKKIKLYLYPNRPDYVPLDNSDLIPKVRNLLFNRIKK